MKGYTDLEQSKKLAEFLPLESADMYWWSSGKRYYIEAMDDGDFNEDKDIRAWSLAALLRYLHKFKPQVYVPILSPTENKWMLNFVEYGHGTVCKITCDNPVDACYEMIIKLNELNLL